MTFREYLLLEADPKTPSDDDGTKKTDRVASELSPRPKYKRFKQKVDRTVRSLSGKSKKGDVDKDYYDSFKSKSEPK